MLAARPDIPVKPPFLYILKIILNYTNPSSLRAKLKSSQSSARCTDREPRTHVSADFMIRKESFILIIRVTSSYLSPVFSEILPARVLLADILAFRRNTENDGKKSNHFQLSKQVLGTERFPRTTKRNCTAHALSGKFPFPFRSVATFPLSK